MRWLAAIWLVAIAFLLVSCKAKYGLSQKGSKFKESQYEFKKR